MKAAYIIPLTRLPSHLEGFDYSIPPDAEGVISEGSVVEVMLRNRKTKGIVFSIHESHLQTLKPIAKVLPPECAVSQQDRQFIEWLSSWYAISLSAAALQMALFLDGTHGDFKTNHQSTVPQPILLYSPSCDTRIDLYRNEIRQQSAGGRQTLIICPTIASVYQLERELSNSGQGSKIAIVHSALGKPAFRANVQALRDGTALVGIGTRMLIFAPCASLGCMILHDSERLEHKQYDSHPRLDGRIVALARARIAHAQAYISSAAPRLEEWQQKNEFFSYRAIPADIQASIMNLSDEVRNGNYSFISDNLIASIEKTFRERKKIFLVLSGSGYSRFVTCASCSYLFPCASCDRLPRYSQTTMTLDCSACSSSQGLPAVCPQCKGSEYTFPGLGREKIISSLKRKFPQVLIGEAPSSKRQLRGDFVVTVGSPYSFVDYSQDYSPLGLLAFIVADPVVSMTDFRACERQWQASAACMSHASSSKADIIIQSFHPQSPYIQTLARMDFETFADQELVIRKENMQPPFARVVRIFPSARTQVSEGMFTDVKSRLEIAARESLSTQMTVSEARAKKSKNDAAELVITIDMRYHPSHPLPDSLLKILRSLPKGFMHDIDPQL